ncbi:MAG TPA: AI-2E family transporter [Gemmataceae bacterium]|nr:AI-2E family transporter [Gemmataceae bacterium]
MPSASSTNPLRPFVTTITLLLVVAAMYLARVVVVPVVLAALLAFLLTPLVTRLHRCHVPRVLAALLAAGLAFAFVAALLATVVSQLEGLAAELPKHRDEIRAKAESIHRMLSGDGLKNVAAIVDETVEIISPPAAAPDAGPNTTVVAAPPAPATSSVWNPVLEWAFAPALEIGVDAGIVIVLVIFMLCQHEDLRNRVIRLSGARNVTSTTKALGEATHRVRRFLFHQFLINCSFGTLVAIGLWLIGVPYPWLWGVLGAALRYIPYVGTWAAMVCPLVISIAFDQGWTRPLLTFALFALMDLLITNILEPIVYGRSVGVSGPALLVAAVFWTWLWGPIGLLLSTPLTACVVVLSRYVTNLEFLGILLGDAPPLSPALRFYQRLLARDEDEAAKLVEEYIQKHGVEKVYDEVLAPALAHAKDSRERGGLTAEDADYILTAMSHVLENVVIPEQEALYAKDATNEPDAEKKRLLVLGCPARDAADETALRMLQQLLPPDRCRFDVASQESLAGEVVARIGETHPAAVVIGAVPPHSFSAVRYLCKRLRRRFPAVKIVVGCWGVREDEKQVVEKMKSAGADLASATFLETRDQLLPLLRDAAVTRAAKQPAEVAPV